MPSPEEPAFFDEGPATASSSESDSSSSERAPGREGLRRAAGFGRKERGSDGKRKVSGERKEPAMHCPGAITYRSQGSLAGLPRAHP